MQIKSIVAGAAISLIAGIGSVSADEFSVAETTHNHANEPERAQFELLKHAGEPIVLSEAEMDGVTAAGIGTSSGFTIYSGTATRGRPTEEVSFYYNKITYAY